MKKEEKLKEENKKLKRALAVCLNRPLLKEIKSALVRIEKGQFVGEEIWRREEDIKQFIKEILDEIAPSKYTKFLEKNRNSDLTFWGFQKQIIKQKSGDLK